MLKLGIIGYGYWGPNILRNFMGTKGVSVAAVCDVDEKARSQVKRSYPDVHVSCDCNEILDSKDIDAVAIITPVSTHYDLARRALLNGKHIFIEKPFTSNQRQAEELINIAEQKHLTIMVDHTFLFCGAVKKIKQLIDENVIGDIYYFDSTRINLGLFQKDVNVIWDLAPHDLSIMRHIIGKDPVAIAATGVSHFNDDIENVAYITAYFPGNCIAHFNVSWLSPVKIRTILIGGNRKMVVWNDLVADEKIRVYDRGVENGHEVCRDAMKRIRTQYRIGDMWCPQVENIEALKAEAEYFVECVDQKKRPINDGISGLNVVKMIEASVQSLRNGGEAVPL